MAGSQGPGAGVQARVGRDSHACSRHGKTELEPFQPKKCGMEAQIYWTLESELGVILDHLKNNKN